MEISLQQAIEIHAKVLRAHRGPLAPGLARYKAERLADAGDYEGRDVWMKVADCAETLPDRAPFEVETAHAA
ncbi:hypothetical protein CCR94_20310 [Rhodoblastus sphagnicola]|uniref:Uncharacterized protein n=1 Tax=Rhodoblastus sphagnicola TaxID=333368 RepID=A0A2S6MXT6_9HYPH|nr:hypothetical protein [Rhodoblastus sphagnicola]MBB4196653.1 hypothetical protein [Rhodoblastus sphagnicola]PPQ27184.1 hypothetical protein CCR94_20310 [Rhodoblastus sphagnicola]